MNKDLSPAASELDHLLRRRDWLLWIHGGLAFVAAFAFWTRPTPLHKLQYGPWSGNTLLVYTAAAWIPLFISWAASRRMVVGSRASFVSFVVVLLLVSAVADAALVGAESAPVLLVAIGQSIILVVAAVFLSTLPNADKGWHTPS